MFISFCRMYLFCMYTLDWLGVFKESFGWLFGKDGKFNGPALKRLGKYALAFFALTFVSGAIVTFAMYALVGNVDSTVPDSPAAMLAGQAGLGTVVLLAFLALWLVIFVAQILLGLYIQTAAYSLAFKDAGMKFKRELGLWTALKYLLYTAVYWIYVWFAIPSKRLRWVAITAVVLEVAGIAIAFVMYSGFGGASAVLATQLPTLLLLFVILLFFVILLSVGSSIIAAYMAVRLSIAPVRFFQGDGIRQSLNAAYAMTSGKALKIFLTQGMVGIGTLLVMVPVVVIAMIIELPVALIAIAMGVAGAASGAAILGMLGTLLRLFVSDAISAILTVAGFALCTYYLTALYKNVQNYKKFE